jgi:hypothetical protein
LLRWLDKGKEDGLIERELFPSQSIVGGINWKMTIITGGWACHLPGPEESIMFSVSQLHLQEQG